MATSLVILRTAAYSLLNGVSIERICQYRCHWIVRLDITVALTEGCMVLLVRKFSFNIPK